jgi:hypothetical protein
MVVIASLAKPGVAICDTNRRPFDHQIATAGFAGLAMTSIHRSPYVKIPLPSQAHPILFET